MGKIWYDRRVVNATLVQFFHESWVKHPDKEYGTNFELDAAFPADVTITRIVADVSPILSSLAVARSPVVEDEIIRILQDMIIEVQVGDGPILRYPFAYTLDTKKLMADLEYTLTTAADGSYAIVNITNPLGTAGLDVSIPVPARVAFKFFVKSLTTPALGKVTISLITTP